MLTLNQIKTVCAKYGITPSKSKGQNFLFDNNIISKIISEADIKKGETILEIGPGVGVLTGELLKLSDKVIAVEIDKKIADFLKVEFVNDGNLNIINSDILKLNRVDAALKNLKYKIVANLPYNITSKFLRLFLEQEPKPGEMIIMVQKEVAKRIVAQPGDMSLLSLSCQFYSDVEILFFVSKKSFWPEPEIDSAVIRLKLKEKPLNIDQQKMFQLARIGFSSKRKQLHNNLSAGLKKSSAETKNLITSLGFDEKIRAQDLSVDDWIKLADKI